VGTLAPIVLFVFNRPLHARRTLEKLAACASAGDSDLIVFADGARTDDERPRVLEARQAARQASGFKSVTVVERDRNLGLARSIASGVTEICRSHGRAIVVEDDLLVGPEFLHFLNMGLDRYENETRVLQVSGYAYPAHGAGTADAFFLPLVSCWGWATWDRAWKKFDPSLSVLPALDRDSNLRRRFNVDGTYDYYAMACSQRDGKINSWGICWQMSLFANDAVALYPRQSLVMNAGFDGSGTHGEPGDGFQRSLDERPFDPGGLAWPTAVETDARAYDEVKTLLRESRPNVVKRFTKWLRT